MGVSRSLRRRLAAVEDRLIVPVPCATCATWFGMVRVDDAGKRSRPGQCPDCGRVVPITTEVHIVGLPLDVP